MSDQAESLRRLVRQLESRAGRRLAPAGRAARPAGGRLIAVSGGKGGVGKSSLAVNLGLAMSATGRRVLLVDADLGLASLDVMLGVRAEYSLAEVALDDVPAERAVVRVAGGLDVLPGASGVAEMADLTPVRRQRLLAELTRLESRYSAILLDTAAGAGEEVRAFLRAADAVIVVTSPEPTAITDAYALAKLLAAEGQTRLGSVVNMSRSRREGERVGARLCEVALKYTGARIEQLGAVPFDWEMAAAVRERRPVLLGRPRSAASNALRRVAARTWHWSQVRTAPRREAWGSRPGLAGVFARTAGY
jgi:flagellar biosynthesis protein FlhG